MWAWGSRSHEPVQAPGPRRRGPVSRLNAQLDRGRSRAGDLRAQGGRPGRDSACHPGGAPGPGARGPPRCPAASSGSPAAETGNDTTMTGTRWWPPAGGVSFARMLASPPPRPRFRPDRGARRPTDAPRLHAGRALGSWESRAPAHSLASERTGRFTGSGPAGSGTRSWTWYRRDGAVKATRTRTLAPARMRHG